MIKSAKVLVAYEASHPSALDRQISVPTPGDNAGTSLFRAGYGSAGSITDSCGQVASLIDSDGGSTHVADYLYLGLGTVVQQDSPQANLRYTLIDLAGSNDPDTGDIYAGLDRFSRIKDLRWRSTSANSDLSRIRYGYDRASSRIWRENPSDTNRHYDWLYANDGMHRLHDAQRGQLNAGHTAITSPQFGQCWTLDETGNWQGFRQDDDGNGSWDLIQARTSNPVNEITDIDNTTGSSWATPAYDANGNTTLIPRPDLGTNKSMIAIWDAWNRLVKLINPDTNQTLVEFVYDGRNFRIVNKEYASGTLSATRHLYYTDSWQAIEERVNTSTTPERQHVWGIRYIDDLVLRERDTNADGTLDERLYHLPDANWNVTTVVDASGSVQERIEYTPYGQLQFLTPTFGPRNASSYDIRTTYTSREWIPESKLYCFRNRWYDPELSRFCSRDPIGFQMNEWNIYEFCNSLPLNLVDPLGLFALLQMGGESKEDVTEIKCPKNPKGCEGGYCVFGKNPKLKSCDITKVKWVEGWNPICSEKIVTPAAICKELQKQIDQQNKKNPGEAWGLNYCNGECDCDQTNLKFAKAPVKIVFKNDLFRNSGCGFEITGTIELEGGEIAITPCKAKEKK